MTGPVAMSTRQQASLVAAQTARVAVFEGSIRAGKTFSWLFLILDRIANAGPVGAIVVVGKNRDSIWRNVFEPLATVPAFDQFQPFIQYRQGAPRATIFGRTVHVIGANDASSESRIRGMTVQAAFLDELTVLHVDFFKQMLGRMSVEGAQLFGTTNPDSPAHWLKRDYLDKVEGWADDTIPADEVLTDWVRVKFTMDDNPSLAADYKASLKREYTGLWHRRFIAGEWVSAEGAVFDMWDTTRHVVSRDDMPPMSQVLALGMDYGTTNPTAGVLLGLGEDKRLYVIAEWAPRRGSTDAELAEQLKAWLEIVPAPEWLFLDPSAASFRLELYQRGHRNVAPATNDVIDGIRTVASLLATDRLKVVDTATNLIGELASYRWDDKASEKGEDKPVKENDHFADALRYSAHSTMRFWQPSLQQEMAA